MNVGAEPVAAAVPVLAVTAIPCGGPLASTRFVMLVLSAMNNVAETLLPAVPPVQVSTMSPTRSARPSWWIRAALELAVHEGVWPNAATERNKSESKAVPGFPKTLRTGKSDKDIGYLWFVWCMNEYKLSRREKELTDVHKFGRTESGKQVRMKTWPVTCSGESAFLLDNSRESIAQEI